MDAASFDGLIIKVASGDMQALEELYAQLSGSVYMLALSITRDRELAQDIMQDTFVRVYSYSSGFKSRGYGRAWVLKIARNLALSARKRAMAEEYTESVCTDNTQEEALMRTLLEYAMNMLDEREREIVMLHASSGLTMAEISKIVSSPLGTVKWRHAQALSKLRKYMSDEEAAQ